MAVRLDSLGAEPEMRVFTQGDFKRRLSSEISLGVRQQIREDPMHAQPEPTGGSITGMVESKCPTLGQDSRLSFLSISH